MKRTLAMIAFAAVLASSASAASYTTTTATNGPKAVAKHRRAERPAISADAARAIALRQVKDGKIKSEELEKERGRLIYSFDITVPGEKGIEELNVDAMNGKVVARQHETPKKEAVEKRQEQRESKKGNTDR